jgi:ketosteroid isomerase-like protein
MSHLLQIQDVYAAFGRGDIPAILGKLADDVVWEYGMNATDVPWLQPRRGRAAVAGFFEALGAVEFKKLDIHTLLENGSTVIALIDLDATVKATGRRVVEEDEAHIWHFDGHGKVARFRHRVDSHQHWLAYHGQ